MIQMTLGFFGGVFELFDIEVCLESILNSFMSSKRPIKLRNDREYRGHGWTKNGYRGIVCGNSNSQ